jgi:hypothetical protein
MQEGWASEKERERERDIELARATRFHDESDAIFFVIYLLLGEYGRLPFV